MASPSTVITLGFGSFGSVNLLPTLGYGIGEEAQPLGFLRVMAAMAHIPGVRVQRIVYPGPAAGGLYVSGVRQQEVHP
jgi:hypothetical protein